MKYPPRAALLLLAATAVAAFPACSLHEIGYGLDRTNRWDGRPIPVALNVATLHDESPKVDPTQVQSGGRAWRINGLDGYADKDVAGGVTAMVVQHLDHSGLFATVHPPGAPSSEAGLELIGTLYDYNSMAEIRRNAERAVVFGSTFGWVPGALLTYAATFPMLSEVRTNVALKDLALRDRSTGAVVWEADLIEHQKYRSVPYIGSDRRPVYRRADQALEKVVNELVNEIGQQLEPPPSVDPAN